MPSLIRRSYGTRDFKLSELQYFRLHTYATVSAMQADASSSTGRLVYCTENNSFYLGTAGTWVKASAVAGVQAPVALTFGSTVATDLSKSDNFTLTLAGNATLSNPTNLVAGMSWTVAVKQNGTGGWTFAYGSNYKFPGGAAPTASAGANAVDLLSFYSPDGTVIYGSALLNFG